MPTVALFKQDGTQNGDITLNEEIFGIEPNESVVYDAIVMQRASLRQGTHAVKNRSAVRGGGRKPWRQKGTDVLVKVLSVHHNGVEVALSSDLHHVHTATNFLKKFVA
jgi:hypothetical protein